MNDEQLDKLINNLEKTKNNLWKVEKKILGFLKNILVAGLEFAFMTWVFLWVYDTFGWQKTLMTLGIGVIIFGLRNRIDGGMKDIEIKELKAELNKLKGVAK